MLHKILVPLDGSEHAEKALRLALDMAGRYDARVILLHVMLRDADVEELRRLAGLEDLAEPDREELERAILLQAPEVTVAAGYVRPVLAVDLLHRIGEAILAKAERAAHEAGVGAVESHIEDGDPARHILARAAEAEVDAIVMGSRGLGYLEGLFVGSVSTKVYHRAHCTCVLVK